MVEDYKFREVKRENNYLVDIRIVHWWLLVSRICPKSHFSYHSVRGLSTSSKTWFKSWDRHDPRHLQDRFCISQRYSTLDRINSTISRVENTELHTNWGLPRQWIIGIETTLKIGWALQESRFERAHFVSAASVSSDGQYVHIALSSHAGPSRPSWGMIQKSLSHASHSRGGLGPQRRTLETR